MPSGFLTLPDGRCFAKRWAAYDDALRAIAAQLTESPALRSWLLEQLPGPGDTEEIGIGAWVRGSNNEIVPRTLDLRQMTPDNQRLFCDAAKRAATAADAKSWITPALAELADMIERFERGEPPLSKSDSRVITPLEDRRVGPGWNQV